MTDSPTTPPPPASPVWPRSPEAIFNNISQLFRLPWTKDSTLCLLSPFIRQHAPPEAFADFLLDSAAGEVAARWDDERSAKIMAEHVEVLLRKIEGLEGGADSQEALDTLVAVARADLNRWLLINSDVFRQELRQLLIDPAQATPTPAP